MLPEEIIKGKKSKIYFKTEIKFSIKCFGNILIDDNISFDFEGSHITIQIISDTDNNKSISISSFLEYEIGDRRKVAFEKYDDINLLFIYETSGSVKDFFDKNLANIEFTPKRVFERIQWRYRVTIEKDESLDENILWSFDKGNWFPALKENAEIAISMISSRERYIQSNELINVINTLGSDKPLHHELIQSAISLIEKNMASAVMLGATALEIGIKELIFKNDSILEGINKESQLPPIKKLLYSDKEQSIIAKHIKGFDIDNSVVTELENFIKIRNDCVHQGKLDITWSKLISYLYLIQELLFYIDYKLGFRWAIQYIRDVSKFSIN